jgi:hypothetical protein
MDQNRKQKQHSKSGDATIETPAPCLGTCVVTLAGNVRLAASVTFATASLRETPDLTLKESVTAGSWPRWLMVCGPTFSLSFVIAWSGIGLLFAEVM